MLGDCTNHSIRLGVGQVTWREGVRSGIRDVSTGR